MTYLIADFYRLIAVFSIFIIQFSILNSQDTWIRTYQPFGDDEDYFVEDIRICPDGGYAVIGSIWNEWEGNRGFMMKTDSNGNFLWANLDIVDFVSQPEPSGFVVMEDGSFITAGNNFWFGGRYLLKRYPNGNIEWTQQLDNDYSVKAIELTNDENIITTGSSMDNTINLQKFDLYGNIIWRGFYLPEGFEYGGGYSVTQTIDGGYALTGSVHGENNNDVLVIKTDENGDSLWTYTYDGYDNSDRGTCIIESSDQELFVSGYGEAGLLIRMVDQNNVFYTNYFYGYLWTVLENPLEDIVIGRGRTRLLAFDKESGDTLWTSQLPTGLMGNGDRGFQLLDDGYICLGTLDSGNEEFIVITKTNLSGEVTDISENELIPALISNMRCYPNPVRSSLNISYILGKPSNVEIDIYNIKGQFLDNILYENDFTGKHSAKWDIRDYPSGSYFIEFKTDNQREIKKIIKLK